MIKKQIGYLTLLISIPAHGLFAADYLITDWDINGMPNAANWPGSPINDCYSILGNGDDTVRFSISSQQLGGYSSNYGGTLWFRTDSNTFTTTLSFDKYVSNVAMDFGVLDPSPSNERVQIISINGMDYANWLNSTSSGISFGNGMNTSASFSGANFDPETGMVSTTGASRGGRIDFGDAVIFEILLEYTSAGGAGWFIDNLAFSNAPIPEPSSYGLICSIATLGLMSSRRRRK